MTFVACCITRGRLITSPHEVIRGALSTSTQGGMASSGYGATYEGSLQERESMPCYAIDPARYNLSCATALWRTELES